MRLVTFRHDGYTRIGGLNSKGDIVDPNYGLSRNQLPGTMIRLLARGKRGMTLAREAIAAATHIIPYVEAENILIESLAVIDE